MAKTRLIAAKVTLITYKLWLVTTMSKFIVPKTWSNWAEGMISNAKT